MARTAGSTKVAFIYDERTIRSSVRVLFVLCLIGSVTLILVDGFDIVNQISIWGTFFILSGILLFTLRFRRQLPWAKDRQVSEIGSVETKGNE
jgi:hypothetical protein